jgi:predicted NBD/HSP70 family sugar kinase
MLRLNPAAGYSVGLKLMENRVTCAITDFESRIVHYDAFPIRSSSSPDATCDSLNVLIQQALGDAALADAPIFGVGIGLAGVIYPQQGIVHYSPYLGWQDYPLARELQARLGLPVYVENDVNTLTLSEHLFGSGRHHDHFVVITVGRGIGMGMILNGQLYQGARGGAGELGHIVVERAVRRAGDHAPFSTLEGLGADPAVVRSVYPDSAGDASLSDVVALAQAGDPTAIIALTDSGDVLGLGIATVINLLCPPLVIVSGEGVNAGELRLNAMRRAMQRYTFNGLLDGVEIIVEPADDQAWARGAASLVIGKVFESPLLERAGAI